jgi:hypothetical protein
MTRPVFTRITLAAAAVLATLAAPAQANLLSNASFEAAGPNLSGAGSYCYLGIGDYRECGSVPGWAGRMEVIASNSGPWHNPSAIAGWNASQGARIAGVQNNSFLEQTLALSAGSYTLTWLDSNRSSNRYSGNSYDVRLDNTVLATYQTSVGDAWAANSLSFNVATTGSHTLRLQGLRTTGDGTSFVDMLSLAAVPSQVPEPASIGLVALALAGLAASRRRSASRQRLQRCSAVSPAA